MSSLEKEITDLHLSLDCGDNVVKTHTLRILPECVGPMQITEYVTSDTLYLSRRNLKDVVDCILKNTTLKNLYLEGNEISRLPDTLFTSLSNLVWLDLRNNQITSLPAEIGLHRCLKTLLLEGNPITELPLELGNVISLKALSLRHCPITCPPQEVVQQGLQCILQYLRSAMAERPVSVRNSLPDMPPVEKLHLTELVKSSLDLCVEVVDEDELQRFRELRQKMIQMDRAEFGYALHSSRHPRAAEGDRGHKTYPLPVIKRDQELLKEWRTHARVMQERKILEHKQERRERHRREEVLINAPYATESLCSVAESGEVKTHNPPPKRIQRQRSQKEHEEARAARDRELEQRIRSHVQRMQERRRRPSGTAQEETEAARQDMEEAKRLQSELAERKQERDIEYRFIAFTGENSTRCYEK